MPCNAIILKSRILHVFLDCHYSLLERSTTYIECGTVEIERPVNSVLFMQAAHAPTILTNLRRLLKFSTTLTQKKPPIYSVYTYSVCMSVQHCKPLFFYHKYRLRLFFFPKQKSSFRIIKNAVWTNLNLRVYLLYVFRTKKY